jgi:hypothetical protein
MLRSLKPEVLLELVLQLSLQVSRSLVILADWLKVYYELILDGENGVVG